MGERRAGDKGSAASRPARRRGADARGPRAFKGPAAAPSACRPAAPRDGTGAGSAVASPPPPVSTGARAAPGCRPVPIRSPPDGLHPRARSLPPPAAGSPSSSGPRSRRCPTVLLPLGAHRALWERSRIVPRAGFVSPPCNKPCHFPPPHRCRCRAPAATLRSARSFPAAPAPAPGCAPGSQPTLSAGTPVCPRAGKPQAPGAGSDGRAPRWSGAAKSWMLPRWSRVGPGPAERGPQG